MKNSVLITGVSSGIGLAMARKFLRGGFQVFGSVRSSATGETLAKELGPAFVPLCFDICQVSEIRQARAKLEATLAGRKLHALINSAGSAEIGPLLHVPLDDFRRQLEVLVVGQLAVIQELFPSLATTKVAGAGGRIINITSISGVNANPLFGCYAAGKHAFEGLSKTLRKEVERFGVRVVVVAPGNIKTAIWENQTSELIERYRDTEYFESLRGLLRHVGDSIVPNAMTAEEFADALFEIAMLPSPAERYTVRKEPSRIPFAKPKVRVIEG